MLNLFFKVRTSAKLLILLLGICLGAKQSVFGQSVHRPSSAPVSQVSAVSQKLCPRDLDSAIEAIINRPSLARSQWGILVEPLNRNDPVYALNARRYFIPASNVKLLTTAAALLHFGSYYQIHTPIYGAGTISNLTSLRLVGRGDPSLTTSDLNNLGRQLQRLGVRQIAQLVVEDDYLPGPRIHPTWEWEDLHAYYGVTVNSAMLNQNAFTLTLLPQGLNQPVQLDWSDPVAVKQWQIENRAITAPAGTSYDVEIVGKLAQPVLEITGNLALDAKPDVWNLAVADPGKYFLLTLERSLQAEGIKISQAFVTTGQVEGSPQRLLTTIVSPPLATLIRETNQESNNLFAEVLLQLLATKSVDQTGLEVLQQTLSDLGVSPESYRLVDGSGLSRHNFLSPEAVVQTLKLMAKTSQAEVYRDSLAVAGVSGTLKRRFQDPPLLGKLKAKTGTLGGVVALSGYLDLPDYEAIAFSIMLNQVDSTADGRAAIDDLVLLLSRLTSC